MVTYRINSSLYHLLQFSFFLWELYFFFMSNLNHSKTFSFSFLFFFEHSYLHTYVYFIARYRKIIKSRCVRWYDAVRYGTVRYDTVWYELATKRDGIIRKSNSFFTFICITTIHFNMKGYVNEAVTIRTFVVGILNYERVSIVDTASFKTCISCSIKINIKIFIS